MIAFGRVMGAAIVLTIALAFSCVRVEDSDTAHCVVTQSGQSGECRFPEGAGPTTPDRYRRD